MHAQFINTDIRKYKAKNFTRNIAYRYITFAAITCVKL